MLWLNAAFASTFKLRVSVFAPRETDDPAPLTMHWLFWMMSCSPAQLGLIYCYCRPYISTAHLRAGHRRSGCQVLCVRIFLAQAKDFTSEGPFLSLLAIESTRALDSPIHFMNRICAPKRVHQIRRSEYNATSNSESLSRVKHENDHPAGFHGVLGRRFRASVSRFRALR